MRVEGPGMTYDYLSGKVETGTKSPAAESAPNGADHPRVGVEDLKNAPPIGVEALKEAVDIANRTVKISKFHLEFQLHEESGRYQVRVVDTDSQEVIRKIPPDYLLDFSAKVQDMLDKALGLLVDKVV